MRRAPQDGQNPRRLHENASELLMGTRRAAQPQQSVGEDAALEKSVELVFDELGQRRAGLRLDLGQEDVEVLLDELIQRRVFGAPRFVVDRVRRWCALNRLVHDRSALSPP